MTRWRIVLAIAGAGVAVAGYWLVARDTGPAGPSDMTGSAHTAASKLSLPRPAENPNVLSAAEARAQRELQYADFSRIAQTEDLPSTFARREALYAIAARADASRLDELIDEAKLLVNESERANALEILLLRLAERDPEAAVRRALEAQRTDSVRLIAVLSELAPQPAWQAMSQVGDPLARMEYQNAIAQTWAAQDPARAFASVAGLPADWTREQLLRQLTWRMTRKDPRLAIDLANTLPDPDRNPLLDAVADQWGRYDPAAAAEWVEGMNRGMQGRLAYRIAGAYVVQQQEEALTWALRISQSPGRNLWSYMVGQIAIRNPHEALQLAQSAENPMQRTRALGQVLTSIASRDPALAMSYVDKLPAGDSRTQTAAGIAAQIARTQPATAVEWLRDLDDGKMRAHVAMAVANAVAERDVDAAAHLIDRIPKQVRPVWISSVAQVYARSDLDKGMQWVEQYHDEAPGLTHQFAQSLAMHSPDAALDVVDRLADEKERNIALANVLSYIAMQSPQTAMRYITRISDDNARAQTAARIAESWVRHDEPAARKWVLSLEPGGVRDTGLSQLIPHLASVDDRISLLGQIQSQDARMNSVFNTVMHLASADPEGARTLLRRYPLDPMRQQQLDSYLRQQQRGW
ncbi:MAG: hypothetical protein ACREV5_04760 [Steroidobacter sp.]